MDKAIIIENISRQLDLIHEQNNNIRVCNGKIPQIDIDIIKANIRKLYEQYCELEKANLVLTVDKIKAKENLTSINEPKIADEKLMEVVSKIREVKEIIAEKPQASVVHEPNEIVIEKETKAIIEENPVMDTPQVAKNETKHDLFANTEATTIADKYKNDTKSLNEKIQTHTHEKSISSRMQRNAIKDLKSAIGINEKFLFINELFKGNMREYNDSIIKLNDFNSLTEAQNFLAELKEKHKWDDEMHAYSTIKDFVERKYL